MIDNAIPSWLQKLAALRDVGVLTSAPEAVQSLRSIEGVHVGLLQGAQDLREAYRVIRELIEAVSADERYDVAVRSTCGELNGKELFSNRPRLDFIPPLPLPQPGEGRPAAYLLNRLSNNVDEPVLATGTNPKGTFFYPRILSWAIRACAVLWLIESGQDVPIQLPITMDALEKYQAKLMNAETPNRFELLLELGDKLTERKDHFGPTLFAVPAPRIDLVRGRAPESLVLDRDHGKALRHGGVLSTT